MESRGKSLIQKVIDKRVAYIAEITANLEESDRVILPRVLEEVLRESERLIND